MQALRKWTGTLEEDKGPSPSVLAEWNKYATASTTDVEAGGASSAAGVATSSSSSLLNTGYKYFSETVSAGVGRAATSVQDGASSVSSSVSSFQMPTTQQFTYFAAFLGGGIFFLALAFTIALPVIVIAPAKFAFSFTVGCALIMSAFAALKGWRAQVNHMMQRERLPFSLGYLGSMLGTLYAALVMHSYILSIACSGAQVVALLYYVMSYFPGGAAGVKLFLGMFYRAAASCFSTGTRAVLG
mmetsp:Transcript_2465/g.5857  ORF Transcript_2465/g.5857 Transcript_2465/m.5857 type:complete len:243 (-) Transcript_2465:1439-2167(-)